MKLCERFLTSFEMTINVLGLGDGVGWGGTPPPDPISYKYNVITCHSERSEESIFLQDNNYRKFYMNILNENT